jgi:hypothetical protein
MRTQPALFQVAPIVAGNPVNHVLGTIGDDVIQASAVPSGSIFDCLNRVQAGRGNDHIASYVSTSGTSTNLVWGGFGNDRINCRTVGYDGGAYSAGFGGPGNDHITATHWGEAGFGTNGAHFDGGLGNDRMTLRLESIGAYDAPGDGEWLGYGYDEVFLRAFGGAGHDRIVSSLSNSDSIPTRNLLDGGGGNDSLSGTMYGGGDDIIQVILGREGNDVLRGDIVEGGDGYSILFGGPGDDWIAAFGGQGNLLDGGLGSDMLILGEGVDEFRFDYSRHTGTVDTVVGFDRTEDIIHLKNLSDGVILNVRDDGGDVHVSLFNDHEIIFKGMGTGEVDSIYNLVDTAEQIIGWQV